MNLSKLTFVLLALSCINNAVAENKFSGFYAGVQAGYVGGDDKGVELFGGTPDGYTTETSPSGALVGAFAGFNKTLANNMFVGVEADLENRGGKDKSFMKADGVVDPNYYGETELKDAGSIRGRFGYLLNGGNTAAYITAGYARANIKRTFGNTDGSGSETHSKWHDGWTLGLGAEHFVGQALTVKAEYRYADYGREIVSTAQVWPGYEQRQRYDNEHSIRLGLAYHF